MPSSSDRDSSSATWSPSPRSPSAGTRPDSSPCSTVSRAIRPGSSPARRSRVAASMPARMSPSSVVDPPPASRSTSPGPAPGPMVQDPSGSTVTTPDWRTTSTTRTTATPSGTSTTASQMRRSIGPSDSAREATSAPRTDPPVSQLASSAKNARSAGVSSPEGVRISTALRRRPAPGSRPARSSSRRYDIAATGPRLTVRTRRLRPRGRRPPTGPASAPSGGRPPSGRPRPTAGRSRGRRTGPRATPRAG